MAATEVPPLVPPSEHSADVVCKPRPLMLKDFLRQDHNSESFDRRHNLPASSRWDGSDTVRYLLNNNGAVEKRKVTRSPATPGCSGGRNNPFARLSAVIHALKMLPSLSNSSPGGTCGTKHPQLLPRSFSKRLLRGYFWNKCSDRQRKPLYELASRKVFVRDIVRRASLDDDKRSSTTWGHNKAAPAACPSSPQQKQRPALTAMTAAKQTHTPPMTSTSTARSSPARASCSYSTSVSSWLELDSDSSSSGSGSGSESVGSFSSPVPEYTKPVAASPCLSEDRERASASFDHDGNAVSSARRSVGDGGVVACDSPPAPTPTPTPTTGHRYPPNQGTDGKEGSAMLFACSQYEDKDQLSPVAVADFPSSDEENDDRASQSDEQSSSAGGAEEEEETEPTVQSSSSSFHQRLASIERVKHRLMWKIHKFETLADLVDPDDEDATDAESMVDGDHTRGDGCSIECSEADEEGQGDEESTSSSADYHVEGRARELLESLKRSCGCRRRFGHENKWRCAADEHEALLLDLFIQGLWEHDERCSRRCHGVVTTTTSNNMVAHCVVADDISEKHAVEDDLLRAARAWVDEEEEEEEEEKEGKGVYAKKKKSSIVDVSSKAVLIKELDREGPWGRCLDREVDEVALALGDGVLDSLLAELLLDMLLTHRNLHC